MGRRVGRFRVGGRRPANLGYSASKPTRLGERALCRRSENSEEPRKNRKRIEKE